MAGMLLSAKPLTELDTDLHLDAPVKKAHLNISLCRQSRAGVMQRSVRGFTGPLTLPSGSATRHPFHNARVNKEK